MKKTVKYCGWLRVQLQTDFSLRGVPYSCFTFAFAVRWLLRCLHLCATGNTHNAVTGLSGALILCSLAYYKQAGSVFPQPTRGRIGCAARAETDHCLANPHSSLGRAQQVFATWMRCFVLSAGFLCSRQRNTKVIFNKGVLAIATLKRSIWPVWSKFKHFMIWQRQCWKDFW